MGIKKGNGIRDQKRKTKIGSGKLRNLDEKK